MKNINLFLTGFLISLLLITTITGLLTFGYLGYRAAVVWGLL